MGLAYLCPSRGLVYLNYTKLSDFHAQFRMVGNNNNQTLKEELKSHFSERKAMVLVCMLKKCMIQLVQIDVVELTNEHKNTLK